MRLGIRPLSAAAVPRWCFHTCPGAGVGALGAYAPAW